MEAGAAAPKSLQQKVRDAHARAEKRQTLYLPIPEFGGMLLGRYKPVNWERRIDIEREHLDEEDPKQQILLESVDYLLAASDGIEGVDGDQAQDLGLTLGRPLADWLGLDTTTTDGAMSDRQALLCTFADPGNILIHCATVRREQQSEAPAAAEDVAGESEAAS